MCAQFTSQHCWNGLAEEKPDMRAVAGTRSLQRNWQIHSAARLPKRARIFPPGRFVKIGCQKKACFIMEHRICTHDEITTVVVLTRQMPTNHVIRNGKKTPVRTFGAFNSGLFTYSADPLIGTDRRIARLARFTALEPARVDILSTAKQRTKESDLGGGG